MKPPTPPLASLLAIVLLACGADEPAAPEAPAQAPETEQPNDARAQAAGLFGALPGHMHDGEVPSAAMIDLGRMLYYEPRLSKNHDVSCNSCHQLDRYGVDNEPTSPGHRGARGDRNSPTSYNAALHLAQFWDGRAVDVEAQAKGPVLNPAEMAMADEASVVAVLASIPGYRAAFAAGFPGAEDPITYDNMALAIGAFERGLVTPGRFDAFVMGDTSALSASEQRGLVTFVEVGCVSCHMGAGVGGSTYQKLGLVNPYPTEDQGRFSVTQAEGDRFLFKVPGLRNVEQTGPYFHDGSVATLDEAVRKMAFHQLGQELGDEDVMSIIAFLGSLTGEIPADYVRAPLLPDSGDETPDPDPS